MPEFLNLLPPAEALARLLAAFEPVPVPETVSGADALDRVLFEDVHAGEPLPSFARSTVDGYAVRAADTFGAGDSLPAYLDLAGEVRMGEAAGLEIKPGQCVSIHTGGMLPEGADAVVMIEQTRAVSSVEIEVYRSAAAGENVIQPGEDVRAGEKVLRAGTVLRPPEIGGLMAIGRTEIQVARRPVVAVISSGDEVVPPDRQPGPGQVRDINSHALAAQIRRFGGQPLLSEILPDRMEAFENAARRALAESDVVVFTAGSSVSVRDLTARAIAGLGQPGVLVHGVSVRPGKPTILAVCDGKPVIGLPGNPVSALVIAGLFVRPVIGRLLGKRADRPEPRVPAVLAVNLSSQAGREDWVPVRLVPGAGGYSAEPIFGRSNLIFSLAAADGLVCIPAAANGLASGSPVDVLLL